MLKEIDFAKVNTTSAQAQAQELVRSDTASSLAQRYATRAIPTARPSGTSLGPWCAIATRPSAIFSERPKAISHRQHRSDCGDLIVVAMSVGEGEAGVRLDRGERPSLTRC